MGPSTEFPPAESLRPFFLPRTIAVVGASRNRTSIGHRLLESLPGSRFTGTIIPVNPHATAIAGLPVYSSLRSIPAPVDLAIIAVPPDAVLEVVDDCAAKQVPAAILILRDLPKQAEREPHSNSSCETKFVNMGFA